MKERRGNVNRRQGEQQCWPLAGRHDQPKLLLLDEPMKNGTIIVEELCAVHSPHV
jgi:ABC-type branched-subunit amino acid transport system ATPase component